MKKSDDQRIRAPRLKSRARARANEFLFLRVRVSRRERRANESSLKLYALFFGCLFWFEFFFKSKNEFRVREARGRGRFCCCFARKKLFTQYHIKIRTCGLQKIHDSLSKKASSLLRKEKRARVSSSFFSLSFSLSLFTLSYSLSLGFIYVCNQNCPVFAPP